MANVAFNFLNTNTHRKVRTLLGRAYLLDGRIEESLEVYRSLLCDFPDDIGALIVLGDLYRLSGCLSEAGELFARIKVISPGNDYAEKQLSTLGAAECCGCNEADPLSREAIGRLAGRLKNAQAGALKAEITGAVGMVEKLMAEENSLNSFNQTLNHLQLMPALIEQQIRQARSSGSQEVAEVLQSLQIYLTRQVDEHWVEELAKEEQLLDANIRGAKPDAL